MWIFFDWAERETVFLQGEWFNLEIDYRPLCHGICGSVVICLREVE